MVIRITQCFVLAVLLHARVASAQDANAAQQMKRDVGAWNVVIKMFGDSSSAPAVSKGTETNAMLGDLWLIGQFKGEIMGMKFEGLRQSGFDPEKKTLVVSWVDSMSPYVTRMEGNWDEKARTMTLAGTGKSKQGNEIRSRMVGTYNKDGSRTSTMYMLINGKSVKMMEFHYTRAEDKPAKSEARGD